MRLRILIVACLLSLCCACFAQLDTLTFKTPNGWKQVERNGAWVFIPGDLKETEAFLVILAPAEDATRESARQQHAAMAKRANNGCTVLSQGDVEEAPIAGGTLVAQGFVVDDSDLGKHTRVVAALIVGNRRTSLVIVTEPASLGDRYESGFMSLVGSIKFKPVHSPAPTKPAGKKAPTGDTPQYFPGMPEWRPSGKGVALPATGFVNGRPQGLWYKQDTATGRASATRYVFLADGTYLTNPRWGGGQLLDIAAQRQITPTSTGTYLIAGGKLSTQTTGFKSRADAYSHGKDSFGYFFKQGAAIYRELKAPSVASLTGTWRAMSTQYVFRADGTFEFGQVSSGYEWIAGSVAPGTYYIDGHLVVLEFTGLHTTVMPVGIVTDKQILVGTSLFVRS